MQDEDRLRQHLEAVRTTGQRTTTVGQVPVGSEVVVAYIGRHNAVYSDRFTVTGVCEVDGSPAVTTACGPDGDIKGKFFAETLCLV